MGVRPRSGLRRLLTTAIRPELASPAAAPDPTPTEDYAPRRRSPRRRSETSSEPIDAITPLEERRSAQRALEIREALRSQRPDAPEHRREPRSKERIDEWRRAVEAQLAWIRENPSSSERSPAAPGRRSLADIDRRRQLLANAGPIVPDAGVPRRARSKPARTES